MKYSGPASNSQNLALFENAIQKKGISTIDFMELYQQFIEMDPNERIEFLKKYEKFIKQ